MDGCGTIWRHNSVFTIVIRSKFLLKSFYIIVIVPAVSHAIFNDLDFMLGYPGARHENCFRFHLSIFLLAVLAGTPTTVTPAGTSCVTTAPAPTTESSPIWIRGSTVAPAPIHTLIPKTTRPHKVAPGEISTPSDNVHSWSIDAFVFIMHCFPIFASGLTIEPAIITIQSLGYSKFNDFVFQDSAAPPPVPTVHGDSAAEIIQNLIDDGGLAVVPSSMAEMIKSIRDALSQADEQSTPAEMLWDIA